MKYGSPRHGTQMTTRTHGCVAAAPSLRANPPSHPAQMMQGPAHALAATSTAPATSLRIMFRLVRVIALTSTARLGVGP